MAWRLHSNPLGVRCVWIHVLRCFEWPYDGVITPSVEGVSTTSQGLFEVPFYSLSVPQNS